MILSPEQAREMLAKLEEMSDGKSNFQLVKEQFAGVLDYARTPETLAAALSGAELAIKQLMTSLHAGGALALASVMADPAYLSSVCYQTVALLLADYERGTGETMSADELRRLFER